MIYLIMKKDQKNDEYPTYAESVEEISNDYKEKKYGAVKNPPTAKQLSYLKSLGYDGMAPKSSSAASSLITKYLEKKSKK